MIKGLERLFDEDFNKNTEEFMPVYISLYHFLASLDNVIVSSIFEEAFVVFGRYYLHYIPSIRLYKLLKFDDQEKLTDQIVSSLE